MTPPAPRLRMEGIIKQYPGVRALDGVSFDLLPAEVHALVGENGAGKSTLMKILAGAVAKDAGSIQLDGRDVQLASPAAAQEQGIGIIYQDFRLVPELTAAENILLGHEPLRPGTSFLDAATGATIARELLERLGESFEVRTPVRDLTTAQRQMVEIAKALSRRVRILVMDEPTAPLTDRETEHLFHVIRTLKADGVSIIYISHRLEEIFQVADRITVLRDGAVVTTCPAAGATTADLIRWMVGRTMDQEFPSIPRTPGDEILRIEHLTTIRVRDVNLTLHRGEILGIAGLVGAGRSDLARAIFGADPVESGSILLDGKHIAPTSPQDAIRSGIGLLTEDRNNQGLFLQRTVRENITIADLGQVRRGFILDLKKEDAAADTFVHSLRIRPANREAGVETLSGGNRQKVVLARWLYTQARVLIFDEPTVGIDVGVKYEIYVLMNELARDGAGVIMISSDLPELLGVCDRIAVMCDGRITGTLPRADATRERVMALATAFA